MSWLEVANKDYFLPYLKIARVLHAQSIRSGIVFLLGHDGPSFHRGSGQANAQISLTLHVPAWSSSSLILVIL